MKRKSSFLIILLFIAVLLVASWKFLPGLFAGDDNAQEIIDKATSPLDEKSVAKAYEGYSDLLIEDSFPWMAEARLSSQNRKFSELGIEHEQFGDAISTAYKATHTDKEASIKEFYQELLANPVFLYSACQWGIETEIPEVNKTFGELNPWMKEFIKITEEDPSGMNHWVTRLGDDTLHVTDEYKVYAAAAKHLFENFDNEGFQDVSSNCHWARNQAMKPGEVRPEVMTYQDNLPWLVLVLRTKDGVGHIAVGSNECDKRLGKLEVPKPQEPEKPEVPKTPETPSVTPPPSNPPSDTPSNPKKDESQNPVYKGNAQQGGSAKPKTDEGNSQYQSTNPGRIKTDLNKKPSSGGSSTPSNSGSSPSTPSYNGTDNATPPATDPIPVDPDNQGGTDNGAVSDPDA